MKSKIDKTVKKFNLLNENDTVLIALSGGADSICLAHYLLSVKDELHLNLMAAHVEHGIRGKESLDDADFVKDFCSANNLPLHLIHIDAVKEAAEHSMGVEEYSRKLRYEFFDSIECDKIATAHNLSDNIETFLFRLARGTSLKGACGIPPVRGKIIRPLIEVSSSEIREYLDEKSIPYRVDSTNSDNDYSRNFIRNKLIPQFKLLNSEFEKNAANFLRSVNENEAFVESHISTLYDNVCKDNIILISEIINLSTAVKKRIISRWLSENEFKVDEYRITKVLALCDKNSRFQLKGDCYAVSANGQIRIAYFKENQSECTFIVDKTVLSVKDFLNKCEFKDKKFDFLCDCDKIVGNVCVRVRKEGDCISPQGRNGKKTLKKLFNELHIPPEIRYKVPVITDDCGVIGVYGYTVDKRVSVDDKTENILILNIRTEDSI